MLTYPSSVAAMNSACVTISRRMWKPARHGGMNRKYSHRAQSILARRRDLWAICV